MDKKVARLLDNAVMEIGYLEKATNKDLYDPFANAGRGNYTKYAKEMDEIPAFFNGKKNGYAWCAVFVCWNFCQVFSPDTAKKMLYLPNNSLAAGCKYAANYYKEHKAFYTSPMPGDQIFFGNRDGATHTGLVYDVIPGSKVYTIEGNKGSSNRVGMYEYSVDDPTIYGYGRPNYLIDEDKKEEYKSPVLEWQVAAKADGFSFPKYGLDGKWGTECETVAKKAIVKKQLIGYKYPELTKIVQKVVGVEVDGKCGKNTKEAIIAYQKKHSLTPDGEVGLNTWKQMLGH